MTEAGFKRLWKMPRRASGGGLLDPQTPRQRYLVEQSRVRYHRRPDAYLAGEEPRYVGELGHIDSFRFILDPLPPVCTLQLGDPAGADRLGRMIITTPDGYDDWIGRAYLAGVRSGTSAIMLGMDYAAGEGNSWGPHLFAREVDLVNDEPDDVLTLACLRRVTEQVRAPRATAYTLLLHPDRPTLSGWIDPPADIPDWRDWVEDVDRTSIAIALVVDRHFPLASGTQTRAPARKGIFSN